MVANSARPETRQVYCTNCDRPIDIAVQAMSVNCRHCHKRVIIEDVKIKTYHAVVRLATAGTVDALELPPPPVGALVGRDNQQGHEIA